MATLSDLEPTVQSRVEEATDGVGVFWSVQNEIRPAIVEALSLATVITGEPQIRASVQFDIPASTSFTPLSLPADAMAILKVEGPGGLPLHKAWLWDLDRHLPGWEVATGAVPQYWIPFGLTKFGIYPCLTAPAKVVLSYVQVPITTPPPYTGAEPVPFQTEYFSGFKDYAEMVLRFKEGDPEFSQSLVPLNRALGYFEKLSRFAYRKGSLRFTRAGGSQVAVNEVRAK